MIRATQKDKTRAVNILIDSFSENKSVLSMTEGKPKRIKALMEYAFNTCIIQGFVYFSDDLKACALVALPDKKRTNVNTIWNDILFCIYGLGVFNIPKALKREKLVKLKQEDLHIYHLWFIGVSKKDQRKGSGTLLMSSILKDSEMKNRQLVLETSSLENIEWYKKFGLKEYDYLDFEYRLFFLTTGTF